MVMPSGPAVMVATWKGDMPGHYDVAGQSQLFPRLVPRCPDYIAAMHMNVGIDVRSCARNVLKSSCSGVHVV